MFQNINVPGRKTAVLVDGHLNAGGQTIVFDASRFLSGINFYRINAGSFNAVKKILFVKYSL
ncbi:MAG: hypothetical protein JXA06_13720 [Bacteroidetes bacterium]|nr:hypothetical protein [Bacteroidota bacterium]